MKAIAVYRNDNQPQIIEKPKPKPESGEALVRTLRVGIDGTDHEVIQGNHGGYPEGDDHQVLGHEAIGVVEGGSGINLVPGDLVVPTVRRPPDGSNEYFDRGEPDMAPSNNYLERGIVGAHGYMAEYFTSPEEFLIPVPDTFASFGFLVEPVSNSEKALELAFASRSTFEWDPQSVLILGNGPLGLLTVAMLHNEYERVYCLGRRDRPDPTIDIIERLGANYIDSRETPVSMISDEYESIDLIYEATGYAKHAFECLEALAPNGAAVLLGIPEDWSFEIDGGRLHREMVLQNKAVLGSVNSNIDHFNSAIQSLADFPPWVTDAIITDVYKPKEKERAFATGPDTIKSVIEFDQL